MGFGGKVALTVVVPEEVRLREAVHRYEAELHIEKTLLLAQRIADEYNVSVEDVPGYDEAVALVGPEVTARYERYLRFASVGFRMGKVGLLRMVLAPVGSPWAGRR